ncbi:AraC family transcriptional regulator [uncultured Draconibacterium sp.]|uniref:AraC family transcriptional regulator n=1 Tax=uncultured Draconibacterium sp. TaxID=1573823 RepID=UPI0029C99DB6|nr:AraC family transcriptional regulator [uncultured Draconibacterium sp.]
MHATYEKLVVDENSLFHFQEFKQERFTSPFHIHDEFELILVNKSHGKLYVGNQVTNFSDGDVFLFAPDIPHCFHNTKGFELEGELAHAVVVQFKSDFLGEDFFNKTEAYKLKELTGLAKSGILFTNPSKRIIQRIKELGKTNNLQKLGYLLFILSELANTKNYKLLTSGQIIHNISESQNINEVIKYVAENFQREISLAKAAEIANMQKAAFCRYFKRRTKKKFMEFVNETRIAHAQKLLIETDKNILEVAYECGYESSSYFYRIFKKYHNVSPVNYRKQIRNRYE